MSEKKSKPPYQSLGSRLRNIRQQFKETVAEVSGAVEIDIEQLERIEQGLELPTEDILMLLISHFGVRDDEAVRLWELAGYDQHEQNWSGHRHPENRDEFSSTKQPVVMLFALDNRVVYTNGIEVVADGGGVVMNFTQTSDQAQTVPVARVGMGHGQAEKVLQVLQQALLHHKYLHGRPKSLPAPKKSQDDKRTPEKETS